MDTLRGVFVFALIRLTAGDSQALSADGAKYSALKYPPPPLALLASGTPLAGRVRSRSYHGSSSARFSPVFSVSISYKSHGRDTSIAKSLARASQK